MSENLRTPNAILEIEFKFLHLIGILILYNSLFEHIFILNVESLSFYLTLKWIEKPL